MPESAFEKQIGGDHYKGYKIDPAKFMHDNEIPAIEAMIIKYVLRHKKKNGIEDLNKAIHMLEMLKELDYATAQD